MANTAHDVGSALLDLWERSWRAMSREELKGFEALSANAEVRLSCIADVLDDAAGRVGAGVSNPIDEDTLASLMFAAANTVRTASAMSLIAGEARYARENYSDRHHEDGMRSGNGGAPWLRPSPATICERCATSFRSRTMSQHPLCRRAAEAVCQHR